MKRFELFLILLFFTLTSLIYGQGYSSELDKIQVSFKQYLNGFHPVSHGISHRNYQGKVIKGDIDGLFDNDVIQYYQLDSKYDSPLKRKMFLQSQEYNTLLSHLEKERKYLLADTFYVVSSVSKTNYDLKEKAFFFNTSISSIVYTTTKFVHLNDVGIVTSLLTNNGIKVEIENENIALEVENNYQDCRLIYIFTFDAGLSIQNEDFPIGKLQKLLLVNIKNGKVYYYQAKKPNIIQYDHDIYAEIENEDGFDIPTKYFLNTGEKMIELEQYPADFGPGYELEEENDKYYVIGIDGKRYLLNFKPLEIICAEKDSIYTAKCEEISKDYKLHPEKYQDVTIVTDGGVHYYIDKSGFEWEFDPDNLGYENVGCYVLEEEGIYMIFDELKFIRKKDNDKVYADIVEEAPEFPGGNSSLLKFLSKNIKYPLVAEQNGIQGRVIVKFIVDEDGSVVDPKVVRSLDPACDKEAIRVVKLMPKWKPGKQDGKPIRVEYSMPVNFKLQ